MRRWPDSMAASGEVLRPCFPVFFGLPLEHSTGGMFEGSLDERLEITRSMLGNAALDAVVNANADDARPSTEA